MAEKKNTEIMDSPLKAAITGAAAGTAAAIVTNPISQVSNMKASHPERHGNQKWYQVVKELWNKPNYSKDQKIIQKEIDELELGFRNAKRVGDTVNAEKFKLQALNTEELLRKTIPKNMKWRAFYSGFSTKALNNALFSAAMFGSLPVFKSIYDKAKNKKINMAVVETNG